MVEISGLSRILLNQLVNIPWVPLLYVQYLYSLAFEFREAELPHNEQVVLKYDCLDDTLAKRLFGLTIYCKLIKGLVIKSITFSHDSIFSVAF